MNVAVRSNVRTAEAAKSGLRSRVQRRVPRRLGRRPARRRPRPARRRRLLRHPHPDLRQQPGLGDRRPDRARLRRLADLGLRPPRRRHLHEGRRRRRRPRRQDRGRNPRGRPAQPRRDRGQRRRQRRRLRRHGRRPLRDLRGHRRRRDAARDGVPAPGTCPSIPLALGGISILASVDRHLLRPDRQRRLDHQRALQERARRHRAVGDRVHPRHDGVRRRPLQLRRALRLRRSSASAITFLLVAITEFYTGSRWNPVKSISKASQTGTRRTSSRDSPSGCARRPRRCS